MAIGLVKDDGSVFIEIEDTEGTYKAEQAAASAAEVLSDGLEFTPTKELLERNTRTSTIETVVSRVGQKSMAGTVPTEFKAAATEGGEPETGKLYEALLGGKDQTTEVTSLTGHTTTRVFLTDNAQYKVGHIVKIKQSEISGEDHVSPILAKGNAAGGTPAFYQDINAPLFPSGSGEIHIQSINPDPNTYTSQNGLFIFAGDDASTVQQLVDTYNGGAAAADQVQILAGASLVPDSTVSVSLGGGVDSAGSQEYIDLLIPYSTSFSDNVKVAASTQYYHKSGAPTLSVTNYLGGTIREKAIGMRPVSAELSSFSTGALPEFSFSLEGLDFDREVGTPLFSPAYDSQDGAEPPVILCSKVFKDATEIEVNEVGISITNTLGFLTSTASCSGKISSRITKLACGFSIDPYMQDNNTDLFDIFEANTGFSLFGSANNYGATDDEKEQVVAFYMPNCRIPEITTGDADGILTDAINGTAHRDKGNDTIFIAFI